MKRLTHLLLVVALLLLISGCTTPVETTKATTKATTTAGQTTTTSASEDGFKGYPMDKTAQVFSIYGIGARDLDVDNYWRDNLGQRIGVTIDFIVPPAGSDANAFFNMMISSGNLPDIIFSNQIEPESYIKDKIIVDLSDLMPTHAPNYYAYVNSDIEINRSVKTDAGQYYGFFHIREEGKYRTWWGPSVRTDLLEAYNLPLPVTLEDWENMLKVIYEDTGLRMTGMVSFDNPLPFVNAFNTTSKFYRTENDTVKLGAVTDEYRQYIELVRDWYERGYIDRDLAAMSWETVPAKILNNQASALQWAGGLIQSWNDTLTAEGHPARWKAVQTTVRKAGDPIKFAQNGLPVESSVGVITTACKDVETAMRICDFGYSKEGMIYWNFADEGVSYDLVDGKPVFKDFILKGGLGGAEAGQYSGTLGMGMTIHMAALVEQTQPGASTEAFLTWGSNNIADRYMIPKVTPTYEENLQTTNIENAIRTYVMEMFFKFIMGQESMAKWDEYVKNIEAMGLQTVLDTRTAQVQRYISR
jgi:putative aldouronate transport system substrate-binding protein